MNLARVTAPTADPVTLEEAKQQCSVRHSDDDAFILGLVASATARFDGWDGVLGRCLVTQTWRLSASGFPSKLPLPPIQSATVSYYDSDDVQQPFTDFRIVGDCIEPVDSWPSVSARSDAVQVDFVAGYGVPSDVPEDLREAIKMLVRFFYDNRGDVPTEIPPAIHMLAAPHRAHLV